jgi:hypothetical protein
MALMLEGLAVAGDTALLSMLLSPVPAGQPSTAAVSGLSVSCTAIGGGAAAPVRRYGTWGRMPGVRRVRTSSSATRMSLMLLSWETRRIRLNAWSAPIL